jgi:hypothetical protein
MFNIWPARHDRLLRSPTTGMAACCARAVRGHTAMPPSPAMNSLVSSAILKFQYWRRNKSLTNHLASPSLRGIALMLSP